MARGWESKSVESQQADTLGTHAEHPRLSPEARARVARREALMLALARVRDELTGAHQPAHRAMLERAVAALEAQISGLSG
jgi:hypothetical protein